MDAPTGNDLASMANAVLQPGFEGTSPPTWLRRRLGEGLGGVALFARNIVDPEQVATLTSVLREERPDLIVAIDEEAGDVTRIEAHTGSSWPGNLALGAIDDPALTREVACHLGRDLAAVGITLNDGLQAAGVAACAKHFLGHGNTSVDSHLDVPIIKASRADLDSCELLPFRAAIASGVRAVMSAHLRVPALDAHLPATLSRRVMTGLLREELGFDGLIVTDGIEMRAISDRYGMAPAAVLALGAGTDAICVGGEHATEADADLLRDAIVAAPLAELVPGTTGVRLASEQGLPEALTASIGRPLVLVVRDPHRYLWMADAVRAALAVRPDAVVVEMGVPASPLGDVHIATYGATRASGQVVAQLLAGVGRQEGPREAASADRVTLLR